MELLLSTAFHNLHYRQTARHKGARRYTAIEWGGTFVFSHNCDSEKILSTAAQPGKKTQHIHQNKGPLPNAAAICIPTLTSSSNDAIASQKLSQIYPPATSLNQNIRV